MHSGEDSSPIPVETVVPYAVHRTTVLTVIMFQEGNDVHRTTVWTAVLGDAARGLRFSKRSIPVTLIRFRKWLANCNSNYSQLQACVESGNI